MDWRRTRGASGNRPRMAWLPMTINSVSPVTLLDARRMCSRSERFIPAQNPHAFILGHDDRKRAAMLHSEGFFAAIYQFFQDSRQPTLLYQIEPLLQSVLGMN